MMLAPHRAMSVIVKALITVTRFPWNNKIWKPNSWCTKAEQYTCIYYNLALYITPVVSTYGMNITRLTRHMSLVEQELLNPPEHLSSPTVFSGVRVSIFSFMCMFCRSLFVLLYVFLWSLCCLFFFVIQIMNIPSNSSYGQTLLHNAVHLTLFFWIWTHNISGDRHWLHK